MREEIYLEEKNFTKFPVHISVLSAYYSDGKDSVAHHNFHFLHINTETDKVRQKTEKVLLDTTHFYVAPRHH